MKKYLGLLLIAPFFVVFPNNTGAEELIKVGEVGNDLDVVFPTAIVDPGVGAGAGVTVNSEPPKISENRKIKNNRWKRHFIC
ncbi:hypothetical protein DV702_08455 [Sporosarcina sp. PTS2304]|uniref:hypothetical protein n=1 Tax=Sporosarcina sp. PTS2304 TaxID=2283194 RepID=UPI000E0D1407|nr:hypothetical protein [Sporosarcina sp. PTS2304]AXH99759.1 hypothetical protein DV702_08455 [Sporosarcina sp. PTS2304]